MLCPPQIMDPTIPTPSSSRPAFSCIRCADRKVKCDRQDPCNACIKHNVQCTYRQFQPPRKKQKRSKQDVLSDRIKQYEVLLQEHGINPIGPAPNNESGEHHVDTDAEATPIKEKPPMATPASTVSESQRSLKQTQLIQGREGTQFVDK